jgi:hypothetical protein
MAHFAFYSALFWHSAEEVPPRRCGKPCPGRGTLRSDRHEIVGVRFTMGGQHCGAMTPEQFERAA